MPTKKPKDLEVGDVFEQPESEEEFHGAVAAPAVREKYQILEIQRDEIMTYLLTRRLSDQKIVEVRMVPWVLVSVTDHITPKPSSSEEDKNQKDAG